MITNDRNLSKKSKNMIAKALNYIKLTVFFPSKKRSKRNNGQNYKLALKSNRIEKLKVQVKKSKSKGKRTFLLNL